MRKNLIPDFQYRSSFMLPLAPLPPPRPFRSSPTKLVIHSLLLCGVALGISLPTHTHSVSADFRCSISSSVSSPCKCLQQANTSQRGCLTASAVCVEIATSFVVNGHSHESVARPGASQGAPRLALPLEMAPFSSF